MDAVSLRRRRPNIRRRVQQCSACRALSSARCRGWRGTDARTQHEHAGPGGSGAPDWVHVAPLPDGYRGEFKRSDPTAGEKYARQVGNLVDAIGARGRQLAGFIAETCPSVGGQLILPPGYLTNVYE